MFLEEEGDILLADNKKITVFAVSQSNLPPNAQILLGIEHLKGLQVSVDFAIHRPLCQLSEAMAFGKFVLSSRKSYFITRNSGLKESFGCLSDSLSFSNSLAMTSVFVLLLGLCLLLKGPNWSGPAISLLALELNPTHLFLEMVLLVGLVFFAAKGRQLSQLYLSLAADLARVRLPQIDSRLSLDSQNRLARMHTKSFASVFAPQPSHFRREDSSAWGERRGPVELRKDNFSLGRCERRFKAGSSWRFRSGISLWKIQN